MPLQNRVRPDGEIVAAPARCMFMGNRGIIHDHRTRSLLKSRWKTKGWVCCLTEFKDRNREVMAKGTYTELFFLDEVTALAAGHRPCYECRRADALYFQQLWDRCFGFEAGSKASQINDKLHSQRCSGRSPHVRISADQAEEAVVYAQNEDFFVCRKGKWLQWSFGGYRSGAPQYSQLLRQITPAGTAAVLKAGYQPVWHPSAKERKDGPL